MGCGVFTTTAAAQTQTLVEHWNGTAWTVVPSPNPGTNANFLNGVAAVSANDVWAVGYYYNGSTDQTLVEHWNGTAWSVVPSPNPGTYASYLSAVAAVSANDRVGCGRYYIAGACPNQQTLVEHWDGTAWSVVTSPNPGTERNSLNGVAAVSANDRVGCGALLQRHRRHIPDAGGALERHNMDGRAKPQPWHRQHLERSGRGGGQ